MPLSYRCNACGFWYHDHGPKLDSATHRRMMAGYGVIRWEDAERLVTEGARFEHDPHGSWEGQECGDLSLTGHPCEGRLVRCET